MMMRLHACVGSKPREAGLCALNTHTRSQANREVERERKVVNQCVDSTRRDYSLLGCSCKRSANLERESRSISISSSSDGSGSGGRFAADAVTANVSLMSATRLP